MGKGHRYTPIGFTCVAHEVEMEEIVAIGMDDEGAWYFQYLCPFGEQDEDGEYTPHPTGVTISQRQARELAAEVIVFFKEKDEEEPNDPDNPWFSN